MSRPVSSRRLTALISALIFLDMITWLAAIPLVPVWQEDIGLTDDQAGMVLAAYSLAVLVFAIPSGFLADRVGARRLTLIGAALFAVAAAAMAFADSFALLIAVRVFQGACSAIAWSAGLAWLAGAVDDGYRVRALSVANATATVATIGGPILGGPIVSAIGIDAAFIGLGVLVLLVIGWALVEPGGAPVRLPDGGGERPLAGLLAARTPGRIQMGFVAIGFVSLMMAALQLLAPLHLDGAGLTSAEIGWVFTIGSVLSVIALVVVARLGERLDKVAALMLLPTICGALVALLLVPVGLLWYAALLVAVIGLAAPIFTIAYAACADGARAAGLGEGGVFGGLNAVWAVGAVISPVLAGVVAEGGISWIVYLVVAALSVVATVVLRRSGRRIGAATG